MAPQGKRIPILFVLPSLGMGGSEQLALNLCRNLDRDRFIPIVATFREGPLEKEMAQAGVPVHVLRWAGGVDVRLTMKLIELIRRYRVGVVNSHHLVALFYSYWATRWVGVPQLHTEHSRWELESVGGFWKRCFCFILRRVELVSGVSQETIDCLRTVYGVSSARSALVLNGIDVELFGHAKTNLGMRAAVGISAEDIVVATVGSLRREKNQRLLLEAVAILRGKSLPIRAALVGEGPCRASLVRLAADLRLDKEVIFLGARRDVPQLYAMMDIFCLPSHYEGLPLTLLEAMASGIPVIGTDVLGIREVVQHNQNGLLVRDGDAAGLAKAILELVHDEALRKDFVQRGLTLVQQRYNLARCLKTYQGLFERLEKNAPEGLSPSEC